MVKRSACITVDEVVIAESLRKRQIIYATGWSRKEIVMLQAVKETINCIHSTKYGLQRL